MTFSPSLAILLVAPAAALVMDKVSSVGVSFILEQKKGKSFSFKQRDECKFSAVKILAISFLNKKALPFPSVRPF